MKKWKYIVLFAAAFLAALVTTAAAVQTEQQALAGKLIRLHVVANSDSKEDQTLKLMVRDSVLAVTAPLESAEGSPEELLVSLLPEIKRAAEDCLQAHGCADGVQVQLGSERFPTRFYDSFSLPAGVYRSLRITIGEGQGHNWWCVVFPSICFRATAEDLEAAAMAAGLTEGEYRLITEGQDRYILKFKTLEWMQALKELVLQ